MVFDSALYGSWGFRVVICPWSEVGKGRHGGDLRVGMGCCQFVTDEMRRFINFRREIDYVDMQEAKKIGA